MVDFTTDLMELKHLNRLPHWFSELIPVYHYTGYTRIITMLVTHTAHNNRHTLYETLTHLTHCKKNSTLQNLSQMKNLKTDFILGNYVAMTKDIQGYQERMRL